MLGTVSTPPSSREKQRGNDEGALWEWSIPESPDGGTWDGQGHMCHSLSSTSQSVDKLLNSEESQSPYLLNEDNNQ